MFHWKLNCFFVMAVFLLSCNPDMPVDVTREYKKLTFVPDYNLHVKPILSDKCFSCHGPDKAKQKAGLRLDIRESAYAELEENPGKVAIDPGNLNGSELTYRILSDDPEIVMPDPESHLSLNAKEKAILLKWIETGAAYKPHWAFVKPESKPVPKIKNESFAENEIDYFVLQKLEEEQLKPSSAAPKEILLRRLSLDLTGLPPTIAEMDRFIEDDAADAYEKQVDRLLRSPHYGEKMAVDWLDLARFGDSHGYTVDRLRDMSPYRDWVINAFNRNMPYDQFIKWQIAGDLLPDPSKDMLIATAFNRNHPQNMEGGIIEEEFQTEYVADRTNTFGDALMGISIGCARCHDHKFDPVTQKNYYELFSFFNNIKEAGQLSWDDAMPSPTIMLPTSDQEKVIGFLQNNVKTLEKELLVEKENAGNDFLQWINKEAYKSLAKQRLPELGLQAHFNFDQSKLYNALNSTQKGSMLRELNNAPGDAPVFRPHEDGKALLLNGDEWLDLGKTGVFRKSDPFTISIRVNIPSALNEGVILHKSIAERLYNFRGYHLYIRNNKLELSMAHSAPSNAITKLSMRDIPRDRWIVLTIKYDGTSKAEGLRIFQNGLELEMKTEMDQLTKDIFMYSSTQPGLQIGAWARGWGLKGGMVDDVIVYNRALTEFEIAVLAGADSWLKISLKSPSELSAKEKTILQNYYISGIHKGVADASRRLKTARTILADSTEKINELMVMQEMPEPRRSFLLKRGNYNSPGEEVYPNTPVSIFPFPSTLPKNRLGLAEWLTHKDHPLTARVAVNRYWQNFFGTGLVKTTEDFGNQGQLPSNPALLDWLAVYFLHSGWDLKKLCKLMVMSSTYRQDSKVSKELQEKDPENRLLATGPSVRLSAEMIRDNVLFAAGLMNNVIGGKSIKPYQPDGLWEINNTTYQPDTGQIIYKRSLYVIVKRSVPNPTLATFDAGSRSYCVVRRQKTNTPLQALVTLNDPTFIEASRKLGEEMAVMENTDEAITKVFRKLTGRFPVTEELNLLKSLQRISLDKFRKYPIKAKGWLKTGQYAANRNIEHALLAANAVVANTIMNTDAAITKR